MIANPSTGAGEAARPTAGKHPVRLVQTGEVYLCAESETLLQGMARIGRKGIPAGCLNGGCGVCKISVRVGSVRRVGAMSRAHVSIDKEARGVCLACRVAPVGGVDVEVVGKMKRSFSYQWGVGASCTGTADSQAESTKET